MADIHMRPTWVISLGSEELLLMLRALGGRIKSEDELARAAKLGDQLTVIRANATKQTLELAEEALKSVAAKQHG